MSEKRFLRMGGGTAVPGGLTWAGFHILLIESGQLNDPMSMMNSLGILILPLLGFMITCYALSRAGGSGRLGLLMMIGLGLMLSGILGASLLQIGAAWLVGIVLIVLNVVQSKLVQSGRLNQS